MIFDPEPKEFHGPKPRVMAEFDYLNRSSRPEAEQVRYVLEEWCRAYPASEKEELLSRLRSRNDVAHLSAVFELTLHQLLRRGGNRITLHPEMQGTRGRPDFFVETLADSRYYLEATLCFETIDDQSGQKRLAQVYDILDKFKSPNFFIGIESRGTPSTSLKATRLRQDLERWLERLDPEQVRDAWARGDTRSAEFSYSEAGVRLVFTAIAKRSARSGTRAIGVQSGEARWSTIPKAISSRLSDKAGKYGRPEEPLIIALNAFGVSVDRDDVMNALFGTAGVAINRDTLVAREIRSSDAFWRGPAGVQNTRVSGVVWTSNLNAWNLADRTLEFVPNPWASLPASELDLPATRWQLADDMFTIAPGPRVGQAIGLPAGWPGSR